MNNLDIEINRILMEEISIERNLLEIIMYPYTNNEDYMKYGNVFITINKKLDLDCNK